MHPMELSMFPQSSFVKFLLTALLYSFMNFNIYAEDLISINILSSTRLLRSLTVPILKDLDFNIAFGQHSGVIDINKDPHELPRFPINEKYGDLKRFSFLIDLLPLQFKNISPDNKYVINNNPPKLIIDFFDEQKNLNQISCFSDEGNNWNKSNIKLIDQKLIVNFREKFLFRRGRINCSLNDKEGWRWFGLQFSVKQN